MCRLDALNRNTIITDIFTVDVIEGDWITVEKITEIRKILEAKGKIRDTKV